jgi:4-amino-4-deoxy-L-arabinose transferase-like glycosyltransferase
MRIHQPPRRLILLACVFALALAVRLLYLWQVRDIPTMRVPLSDSRSYYEWSGRIAQGQWWKGDVFYQAPLYPYFLAGVRLLGGDPLVVIRVVQAILGAASCVLLCWAGVQFAGWAVGIIAGLLLALNAPGIYFGGLIQKTVLDTFLLTALLACLGLAQHTTRKRTWLMSGVLLALLCLSRENALLLLATVPIWIALRFRHAPARQRVEWIASFFIGAALVLTPVAIRNAVMGGGFVITTSQFGPNLYIGNNPATGGTYVPLRPGREDPAFERTDATELAEAATGRKLSPGEVSAYWVQRTLEFVRAQPVAWMKLTVRKALLLLNATEIVDIEDYYIYAKQSGLLRTLDAISHFGIVLALAAAGAWITWRHRARLWVLYLVVLTLYGALIPFCIFGRYRFPLVPPLLLFVALALVHAWERMRRRELQGLVMPGIALGVFAGVAQIPLISRAEQQAAAQVNLGTAAAHVGRLDDALRYEDEAIRVAPRLLQAHFQRGAVLWRMGRTNEARAEFEKVLGIGSGERECHGEAG